MMTSRQPVYLEAGEFEYSRRLLSTIEAKAANLKQILQAVGARSAKEFDEAMKIIRTLPPDQATAISGQLEAWRQERNECAEAEIWRTDARHAEALGLPALASLLAFCDAVERARRPIKPAEIMAMLGPVAQIARGEATERIRLMTGNPSHEGVPGVGAIPHRLLERGDTDLTIII